MNKIVSVSISNAKSRGFGLDGSMTREEWQDLCLDMVYRGSHEFHQWQESINKEYAKRNKVISPVFDFELKYEGEDKPIGRFGWSDVLSPLVLDFTGATFSDPIDFDRYVFLNGVIFCGSSFEKLVQFNSCNFKRDAYFQGANFLNGASFSSTVFDKGALFNYSVFGSPMAFFYGAKFKTIANFQESIFETDAYFNGTELKYGIFTGVSFLKDALFKGDSQFNEGMLQSFGPMDFSGANFIGRADFCDREFTAKTSFGKFKEKCTHFKLAPLFHNCKLHQDTDIMEAVFDTPSKDDVEALRAYRTLRLGMEQFRATREQSKFFELEQISYRQSNVSQKNEVIISILYQLISNYGQSIVRPISWFFGLIPLFAGVYYASSNSISRYSDALKFTIEQYIKPFSLWSTYDSVENHGWIILILGSIQSIIGITLLALFLFALRWKFKK